MACVMLLVDLAAVKVAIEVCNNKELKKEILSTPGNSSSFQIKRSNESIEAKAAITLRNLGLPKKLQEKVMGLAFSVGKRMMIWADYHEEDLRFSREYSTNFLNSSFFTQQGIIDSKKAAEELIYDENLNVVQKYKLGCMYCFKYHIYCLYEQMTEEDMDYLYCTRNAWSKRLCLVQFLTNYLKVDLFKICAFRFENRYMLEKAIESGSKAAVEYCLEESSPRIEMDALTDILVKGDGLIERMEQWRMCEYPYSDFDVTDLWLPRDYYVDILYFLLTKMRKDQLVEFLKKCAERPSRFETHFGFIKHFLHWPYQGYFMKIAGLAWEFLPEREFTCMLFAICGKMESNVEALPYGEEKSYNYRGLFKQFWYQSPEHYKRFFLSKHTSVKELLIRLLALKTSTYEDIKNIELILESATDEEKQNITSSEEWRRNCIELIKQEKWEILDECVLRCFSYEEGGDQFKRELILSGKSICIDFVKEDKLDAAESFVKWCSLPEEDINQFKREMIHSADGRFACVSFLFCEEEMKLADKFIRWFIFTEEEVKEFKEKLTFSEEFIDEGVALIGGRNSLDLLSSSIDFCISSEKDVRNFKKIIVDGKACTILKNIIFPFAEYFRLHQIWQRPIRIQMVQAINVWETVETFLTWCFSSEAEMSKFKKEKLLGELGMVIHFKLIESNLWEEAETFFAWLELSAEEVKQLKKDTLFYCDEASLMFAELIYSEEGDIKFSSYGSKEEAIELFLRWYLTDRETVLEFKDEFRSGWEETDEIRAMLENFDLAIEQRLKDLDEEQGSVKRNSETSVPDKRLCNSDLRNERPEYGKRE